jgi:glycosyltransferase involved in cell wall biosynthesis
VSAQLYSLLCQRECIIEIFVRDDGSSDNTMTMLHAFADGNPRAHVVAGENIGITGAAAAALAGHDARRSRTR